MIKRVAFFSLCNILGLVLWANFAAAGMSGGSPVSTTAAAGTLTGTTLASNVVTSSLTTVGALNAGSIATGFGAIDTGADNISGGDFSAGGGDITCGSATTCNVANVTATTVALGGAATTLTIGASTGTTTIANATTSLTGDLNVVGGDITCGATTTCNVANATATTVNMCGAATTACTIGQASQFSATSGTGGQIKINAAPATYKTANQTLNPLIVAAGTTLGVTLAAFALTSANDRSFMIAWDATNWVLTGSYSVTGGYSPIVVKTSDATRLTVAVDGTVTVAQGMLVSGVMKLASSQNEASCTLDAGTPSKCTATVAAGSKCVCTPVATTAAGAATGCAASLSSTTATFTSGAAASNDVNYICFAPS